MSAPRFFSSPSGEDFQPKSNMKAANICFLFFLIFPFNVSRDEIELQRSLRKIGTYYTSNLVICGIVNQIKMYKRGLRGLNEHENQEKII